MKDIGINLWREEPNETEIEKFERISWVWKVWKFSPSNSLDAAMCIVMPTIWIWMRSEIHAALAHEPGIMLVSIDDFRWKTRDEVNELLWWSILIDDNLHPEIEEERGIVISKLIDITNEQFAEKVSRTRWYVWADPKDLANQIENIVAFEIKARKDLETPHKVFERETKSTKSFIKKMNQEYARKKYRK